MTASEIEILRKALDNDTEVWCVYPHATGILACQVTSYTRVFGVKGQSWNGMTPDGRVLNLANIPMWAFTVVTRTPLTSL